MVNRGSWRESTLCYRGCGMKSALTAIIVLVLMLFFSLGCTSQGIQSLMSSASTKTVTIPHSGEQVGLKLNYSGWGSRGGSESYASLSANRNITYYYANGPGGNTHRLYYSDNEIEYTYTYSGEQLYQFYRCVRGNCSRLIDSIPFGKSPKGNSCPDSVELISCFPNGTYLKISAQQEDPIVLFRSKNMDKNEFMKAQSEYNEKNNETVSITLSQADTVELGGWRPVCKYPFEVYTGGASFDPFNHKDVTNDLNFLIVGKINSNLTNEVGNGCPDR